MMNTVIQLTDEAVQHIQSMMDKNNKAIGFRLSVKKTGCSGFAYVPDLIETIYPEDIYFKAQNGLAVYVDAKYIQFLKNCIIDYIDESKMVGIKQKRLVFRNPNEKDRCGCGESFTIE